MSPTPPTLSEILLRIIKECHLPYLTVRNLINKNLAAGRRPEIFSILISSCKGKMGLKWFIFPKKSLRGKVKFDDT